MIHSVEWLRLFILDYPSFQYALIFIGVMAGGEIVLLGLAFLAAQNLVPLPTLFIFSFLGTLSSDSIWFLLGNSKLAQKVFTSRSLGATVGVITSAIERMSRHNNFIKLILCKFMVGTRILILVYMRRNNLSFNRFIKFNIFAVLLWLLVIIPIGFLSGLGFTYLAEIFQNLYVGVGFLLLIIIVIIIFQSWLKKKFLEEQNR